MPLLIKNEISLFFLFFSQFMGIDNLLVFTVFVQVVDHVALQFIDTQANRTDQNHHQCGHIKAVITVIREREHQQGRSGKHHGGRRGLGMKHINQAIGGNDNQGQRHNAIKTDVEYLEHHPAGGGPDDAI